MDQNEDVGGDASKSNSAIIHTGYDAAPGTLESQLVVAANPMYDKITEDLDVPLHGSARSYQPSPKSSTSNCRGFKRRPSVTMCTM